MREHIYDVLERGETRAYWVPKRFPTSDQKILKEQRNFIQLPVAYTLVAQLILPAQDLTYFFLQNLSLANDLWVGFGTLPDPASNRGTKIPPEQAYEPMRIPQNDIWVIGSAAGAATLIYSLDPK